MATGYSGTPLINKLGIKQGMKVLLLNQPANYDELLEKNIGDQLVKKNNIPDMVHLFVKSNKIFEKEMLRLKPLISKNPAIVIWVSWYKKVSKKSTELNEDIIRSTALALDLVDVKVASVNEDWSALKLVIPVAKR